MEFLLIWETFTLYKQHVEFYGTKEELFEAKKKAEKTYSY